MSGAGCRLSFTEEMKGAFAFGEADYEKGSERGRASGTALMFHLTIVIDDVDAFVADPARPAVAHGYVRSEPLGGTRPVERGEFNLFVDAGEADGAPARHMRYRLWFTDGVGHPLTLAGFKDIRHPAAASRPSDVWAETTTLYTRISTGWVPGGGEAAGGETAGEGEGALVGAGILRILPLDFARQLTTFRVAGPGLGVGARAEALGVFGRLFAGQLWDVFARRAPGRAGGGPGR